MSSAFSEILVGMDNQKLFQERLCLHQVRCFETFFEPIVNRRQQAASLTGFVAIRLESCRADCRSQLKPFGVLSTCELYSPVKNGIRLRQNLPLLCSEVVLLSACVFPAPTAAPWFPQPRESRGQRPV